MGLLEGVAWIVGAYGLFVAAAAGLGVAFKAPRPTWLDQFAWMLTLLSIVLALVGLGLIGGATRPASMSTFLGYLGAAVVVMPTAIMTVRHDRGVWSSGVIAVAALGTAVVAWRVVVTA